jgi:DNA-binding NarL/FixJ family response regulator
VGVQNFICCAFRKLETNSQHPSEFSFFFVSCNMEFLIADDHPIFRSGLKSLLVNDFPSANITEFSDGELAEKYILDKQPDIAILDIDMPGKTGLDVCLTTQENSPTRTIILTMYNDAEMLRKAKSNGAWGYLVKDNTADELTECIRSIMANEKYVAKSLRDSEELRKVERKHNRVFELLNQLSQTELKTLKLVSEKYSSKEIADLLFVSTKSVENYRSRICKKLQLDARNNSLLIWVMEHKELVEEFCSVK